MIKCKYIAVTIGCLALQATMPAAAAEKECCLRVTPYLWAMGIDGEIKAEGEEFNASADFADIVDNLDVGGSLMVEYNKGHWANLLQVDYLSLENDDVDARRHRGADAHVDLDSMLGAAATGYRFNMGERSTVDLLVGVRYADLDAQVKIASVGSREADNSVTDGAVFLRPRLALGKHWTFSPTMSVGAGDSDLVWELAPEMVYTNDCCNLEFRFGYRTLNYEFEKGNDELDISIAGPMVGLGFAF